MTFNEIKNTYEYLLKFFNKTQIIEFCCVSQSQFLYFMKTGKGCNKEKIEKKLCVLKSKLVNNAKGVI